MDPKRKRKPVEALRVPFNCFISPATKEAITGIQNRTKESQGAILDRVFSTLAAAEPPPIRSKKMSQRDAAIQKRAAGDVTAQAAERDDIDYSDVGSTPTTPVSQIDHSRIPLIGKVALDDWRAKRKPLLKPKEQ